ncbi:hypothetical protein BDZ97DRAFT_2077187, partial [Flammula alnicola]
MEEVVDLGSTEASGTGLTKTQQIWLGLVSTLRAFDSIPLIFIHKLAETSVSFLYITSAQIAQTLIDHLSQLATKDSMPFCSSRKYNAGIIREEVRALNGLYGSTMGEAPVIPGRHQYDSPPEEAIIEVLKSHRNFPPQLILLLDLRWNLHFRNNNNTGTEQFEQLLFLPDEVRRIMDLSTPPNKHIS